MGYPHHKKLIFKGLQYFLSTGSLKSIIPSLQIPEDPKKSPYRNGNDELKNMAQVEYSRHRCFDNFIVNLLGAIAAYCLFPKKPCINVQRDIDTQLALF